MTQSTGSAPPLGLHVAIIMDGNGRWATRRGLPRIAGHREGAKAVRRVVEAAPSLGIRVLTLFAFSSDNWHRPAGEVNSLMRLFCSYLDSERLRCIENGIRLQVIGRRDRLSPKVLRTIEHAERATECGQEMALRIAVDYSARDAIVRASRAIGGFATDSRDAFARSLAVAIHADSPARDVDLLIRTGGEQRLSDFLLWECAYAELYFARPMWPDFGVSDLEEALSDFRGRDRRFGRVHAAPVAV